MRNKWNRWNKMEQDGTRLFYLQKAPVFAANPALCLHCGTKVEQVYLVF
ncbi:hypothetical protein MuYL_4647 [Mucilaginibacter xinganensis]|uniref:Uncharacterized protein n=1 Tax=Mucilaginibacter xinganensis TaxID=1234841 RepID=A0A223P3B1_9SPHI|nr:hypothetical protein MuYL_4647 [Mucilaginibacter xinganensis]